MNQEASANHQWSDRRYEVVCQWERVIDGWWANDGFVDDGRRRLRWRSMSTAILSDPKRADLADRDQEVNDGRAEADSVWSCDHVHIGIKPNSVHLQGDMATTFPRCHDLVLLAELCRSAMNCAELPSPARSRNADRMAELIPKNPHYMILQRYGMVNIKVHACK